LIGVVLVLALIIRIGPMGAWNATNTLTALRSECKPPHDQLG
jgi:hypothetical protein